LVVGCLVTLAPMILPELAHTFVQAHALIELPLVEGDQERLMHALLKADVDMAITYDLDLHPSLRFRPLVSLPPHVMVGEDHPLARRPSVTLEALQDEDFLLLDLPMSSDYFLSVFRRNRASRPISIHQPGGGAHHGRQRSGLQPGQRHAALGAGPGRAAGGSAAAGRNAPTDDDRRAQPGGRAEVQAVSGL
jgi:DNA-binding transcriptional LysR family regulator